MSRSAGTYHLRDFPDVRLCSALSKGCRAALYPLLALACGLSGTLGAATAPVGDPHLETYPSPSADEMPRCPDFPLVEVRPAAGGGAWTPVVVYDHVSSFAGRSGIAAFGLDAPVQVRVTYKAPVTAAAVLPSRRGIAALIAGSTATFTVPKPQNLVVNLNGDIDHPLCLFANPLAHDAGLANDPEVDYYAPGHVHALRKTAAKRIHIAGGAVVRGAVGLGSGMALTGYGMLLTDTNTNALKSWGADGVSVRGVIVSNVGPGLGKQGNWTFLAFATSHLTVDNVKFFDVFYGEDGIDLDGDCHEVAVTGCFFHLADDCVALKSSSWQAQGKLPRDVRVAGCVFWQDTYGNAVHFGSESCSRGTLTGVRITDNDVVRALADLKQFPQDSLINVHTQEGAGVADLVVEGLHVENSARPRLAMFRVASGKPDQGIGAITGITIRDVHVVGKWVPCEFVSHDVQHAVGEVACEGLFSDSHEFGSPAEAGFILSPYTRQVSVAAGKGADRRVQSASGPAAPTTP